MALLVGGMEEVNRSPSPVLSLHVTPPKLTQLLLLLVYNGGGIKRVAEKFVALIEVYCEL